MPADTNAVTFKLNGDDLVGIYYVAETDQPAPFALFLHGMPGSEKNHDIAQQLRANGWHVLVLHFAGTWGSGGSYNIPNHPNEARAALDFALNSDTPQIDPNKIAVVGFSMGTRAALFTALLDDRVGAVVGLCGFCDFSEAMLADSFFEGSAPFYRGVTGAQVAAQFRALGEGMQPTEAIANLAPRPVLVVHGTADEVVPLYNAEALAAGGSHIRLVTIEGANHTFASHRRVLSQQVCAFLNEWAFH